MSGDNAATMRQQPGTGSGTSARVAGARALDSREGREGGAGAAAPDAAMSATQRARQLAGTIGRAGSKGIRKIPPRPLLITLEVVVGAIVILAILLAAAHVRLRQGPIEVSFLVAPIQDAINREIAPFRVEIGGAVIRRQEETGEVGFRLTDLVVINDRQIVVAVAPSAGVGLSASALMSGLIAPSRIDLYGPALQVYYDERDGLALSASGRAPDLARSANASGSDNGAETAVDTALTAPDDSEPIATIAIAQTIAEALEQARAHATASSYLSAIGMIDARIILFQDRQRSQFTLPELSVELRHRQKRSYIAGKATLRSADEQWTIEFDARESQKEQQFTLTAGFADLTPSGLAAAFPQFPVLAMLAMPVNGSATMNIGHDGTLRDLEASVTLGQGPIQLAGIGISPLHLDEGELKFRYTSEDGTIEFLPSRLRAGSSQAIITGSSRSRIDQHGRNIWDYELSLEDSAIGDADLGLPAQPLDSWIIAGAVTPSERLLTLTRMELRAGEAALVMAGQVSAELGLSLAGAVSKLPIDLLKRLWPVVLAAEARDWVAHRVGAGEIQSGRFRFALTPSELKGLAAGGKLADAAMSAEVRANGLDIDYLPGLAPLRTGPAILRLTGSTLSLSADNGFAITPSGGRIDMSAGRFTVTDMLNARPIAVAEFATSGPVPAVLEFIDAPPLGLARATGLDTVSLAGKTKGEFQIRFPLLAEVSASEVEVNGAARIEDLEGTPPLGKVGIDGGTIDVTIKPEAVEAKGDVLLNGVVAKLQWHRRLDGSDAAATPLRITATLDSSDRRQLGLAVDHMLVGDVPVTLTIDRSEEGPARASVEADLTGCELVLEHMAWRKLPGQAARLNFRVVPGENGAITLQDFSIVGDDIAIAGTAELSAENRLTSFHFPDFSFNVITHMEVSGTLGANNVWTVRAQGPTYDGRQLFRSLFSAGKLTDRALPPAKFGAGIDLDAEIGALVGYGDASIRNLKVRMQRRDGQLAALEARGELKDGKPVRVWLDTAGKRLLHAEAADAGEAFRAVGFYQNVKGGSAALVVDLQARGAIERSGILEARNFTIVGSQVVTKVLSEGTKGERSARLKREQQGIGFTRLRVPFSAGRGQLVLHDSFINGPEIGATMRGKVDFNRRLVQLSGTYVPLFGLNCILSEVLPPLSILLSGRYGECLFGITFAVQGDLDNPQVGVNPMSALAPGVFRQIFEFPSSQQIPAQGWQTSTENQPSAVQASSMPPMTAESAAQSAQSESIGEAMEPQIAVTPPPQKTKKRPSRSKSSETLR